MIKSNLRQINIIIQLVVNHIVSTKKNDIFSCKNRRNKWFDLLKYIAF